MATTLKRENRGKPTPPIWRKVGKALVWLMPVVSGSILMLPVSILLKSLIVVGANLLLAIGKELTTYTFDPKQVPPTYDASKEVKK